MSLPNQMQLESLWMSDPVLQQYTSLKHTSPQKKISFLELISMADNPYQGSKLSAPLLVASLCDKKTKNELVEYDQYTLLVVDIDDHNLSVEAIRENLNGVYALIYTTASHTANNRKYRVVIPVETPMNHDQYLANQNHWCGVFGGDAAMERAQQGFFAPTLPANEVDYHREFVGDKFYIPKPPEPRTKPVMPTQRKVASNGINPDTSPLCQYLESKSYTRWDSTGKYDRPGKSNRSGSVIVSIINGVERVFSHSEKDPLFDCDGHSHDHCSAIQVLEGLSYLEAKNMLNKGALVFKNAPPLQEPPCGWDGQRALIPDNVVQHPATLAQPPSLSVSHDGEQSIYPDVKIQRNGTKILSTADNLKSLLSQLNVQVATNRMNLNMDVQHGDSVHEWDYDELRSYLISEAEKTRLPKVAIDEHLTAIAIKNSYHPIEAKFTHKQWDGIPRVQRVINCLPTDNTMVRDVIMRKWLIAAVAAIYQPNFSTKLVPVLKGTQSAMKSAFISRVCSILPNSFLGESDLNADDVDSVIRVLSHHIVELAELERTTKREAGSLKAFITSNEDKFRKKYGRSDTAKKRQTVFIATVNDDEFFKDSTGNTRFGVIDLNDAINMDEVNSVLGYSYNNGRILHDRPDELIQFWLEVKQWFDSGESWILTSDEQVMTEEINNNYAVKSQYYHDILENIYWFMPDIGVTSTKIASLMGLPRGHGGRVGRALNELVRDGHLRQGAGRERRSYYKA